MRGLPAHIAAPEPDDSTPLTDRQALLAQYDAVLLGDCTISFWEHRRPGALAALYAWAGDHDFSVREISGDPVCYEATIPGAYHTITVFAFPRKEAA